jgi:hypothetical protein
MFGLFELFEGEKVEIYGSNLARVDVFVEKPIRLTDYKDKEGWKIMLPK